MASAEATDVFNCNVGQFYKIITDYSNYPQFLQEVKECKVLKAEGNKKLVEFTVSVMKTFKYTMWITEVENESIQWQFAGGDLFKTSSGYWKISDEAGKTRGKYFVDASFNMFVPGPIAKALVSVNLPNMMSSYHKRVTQVYGG